MCDPFRNQFHDLNYFPVNSPCGQGGPCGQVEPIYGPPIANGCGCGKNKCNYKCKIKKSKKFVADLTGCQQIPKSCSRAIGSMVALLSPCNTKLDYVLQTSGMCGITSAHFHVGSPDCNGPIVKRIDINPYTGDAIGRWSCNECESLTPELVCKLKEGEIYINVHTRGMPAGEIRGQVEILQIVDKCKD